MEKLAKGDAQPPFPPIDPAETLSGMIVLSSEDTETGVTRTSMKIRSSNDPPPNRTNLPVKPKARPQILVGWWSFENVTSKFACLACNAFLMLFLCFKLDFYGDPSQALRLQTVVLPSIEQKAKHLPTEATPAVDFISFEFGQQPLPVRDVQILPQHISRMRRSLTPFIKWCCSMFKSKVSYFNVVRQKSNILTLEMFYLQLLKCLLRTDWMTLSPLYTYHHSLNQKVLKGWRDFSEEAQHFRSPSSYRKCCQSFQLN